MQALTGTGYSRTRVLPGWKINRPGYFFRDDEVRNLIKKLDKADRDSLEIVSLKKSVALLQQRSSLDEREIVLWKREIELGNKEAKINENLFNTSQKALHSERRSNNFFDKFLKIGAGLLLVTHFPIKL